VQEHHVDDADLQDTSELAAVVGAQRKLGQVHVRHVELQLRVAQPSAWGGVWQRAAFVCAAAEAELILRRDASQSAKAASCMRASAQGQDTACATRLRLPHDDSEATVRRVRDGEAEGRAAIHTHTLHVRDVERVIPEARGTGLPRGQNAVVAAPVVSLQARERAFGVVLREHLEEHIAHLAAYAANRRVCWVAQAREGRQARSHDVASS